jgi:tRNA (cmo5U34)-methyltransferase
MKKDDIYSQYREKVADFVFDEKVVSVFDDMIRRSVPGYATVIAMSKVFAEHYAQENSNCYDLGCSLGATTLAMRKGINKKNCRIVAVDNSPAMIERCRQIIDSDVSDVPVDVVLEDIAKLKMQNASIVAMNFTLQFFSPDKREDLLGRIYNSMLPGGAMLLSEKIKFGDDDEQNFQTDMYHHFKQLNGYTGLEVSQKRKALENVLVPDTIEQHFKRLKDAGFDKCYLWFRCFNFVSIAAFKK